MLTMKNNVLTLIPEHRIGIKGIDSIIVQLGSCKPLSVLSNFFVIADVYISFTFKKFRNGFAILNENVYLSFKFKLG